MKRIQELSKIDKILLWGMIAEGVFGVIGGSMIITEGHPYISLTCVALAMAASKVTRFLEKKEAQANNSNITNDPQQGEN